MVHELTRRDARRIAVRAQLLDAERPNDLLSFIRRVTLLQVDMTAAVAPNVDLVSWSRLGADYEQQELDGLIHAGSLVEFRGVLRPSEDMALFRAEMAEWPGPEPLKEWQEYIRNWVEANKACREDILERLRSDGPLPAREIEDTCAVPWRSTGWTNNRNVLKMLDFMEQRGEVAVANRDNRERAWDLAERIYPDSSVVPLSEARRIKDQRRLASLGIARARGPECPVERQDVGDAGEPAVIEGVRGAWRVDPQQLGQPFRQRAALLSPLDRLVVDRKRLMDIFEYDYQLEMYKPASKRRWGYFALPILYSDRLVGKLDAASDFDAGVLRINAIHQDVDFTKAMSTAVDREIRSLANWLGLRVG